MVCFIRVYSTFKVLSLYITLCGVKRHGRVQKHKTQYSMTAGNGNSVFYRNKTESAGISSETVTAFGSVQFESTGFANNLLSHFCCNKILKLKLSLSSYVWESDDKQA